MTDSYRRGATPSGDTTRTPSPVLFLNVAKLEEDVQQLHKQNVQKDHQIAVLMEELELLRGKKEPLNTIDIMQMKQELDDTRQELFECRREIASLRPSKHRTPPPSAPTDADENISLPPLQHLQSQIPHPPKKTGHTILDSWPMSRNQYAATYLSLSDSRTGGFGSRLRARRSRIPASGQPGTAALATVNNTSHRSVQCQASAVEWNRFYFSDPEDKLQKNPFFKHFDVCLAEPIDPDGKTQDADLKGLIEMPGWMPEDYMSLYYAPLDDSGKSGVPDYERKASPWYMLAEKVLSQDQASDANSLETFCFFISRLSPRRDADTRPLITLLGGVIRYLLNSLLNTVERVRGAYEKQTRELERALVALKNDFMRAMEEAEIEATRKQHLMKGVHKLDVIAQQSKFNHILCSKDTALKDARNQIEELEMLLREMREQKEDGQEQLNKTQQELATALDTIGSLQAENASLQDTIGSLQAENAAITAERDALQAENAKLQSEMAELRQKIQDLQGQLSTATEEITRLAGELSELMGTYQENMASLFATKMLLKASQEALKSQNQQLELLRAMLPAFEQLKTDAANMEKEIELLKAQLDTTQAEKVAASNKNITNHIKFMMSQSAANSALDALRQRIAELSGLLEKAELTEQENQELRKLVEELKQEKDEALQELAKMIQDKLDALEKLAALQKKLEEEQLKREEMEREHREKLAAMEEAMRLAKAEAERQAALAAAAATAERVVQVETKKAIKFLPMLKKTDNNKDLEDELARLKAQLDSAKAEAKEQMDQMSKTHGEDEDGFLNELFGFAGRWRNVRTHAGAMELCGDALEHVTKKYRTECCFNELDYDPAYDNDGEDDPNTYDDNVFRRAYNTGYQHNDQGSSEFLDREQDFLHYVCVNKNEVQEMKRGGGACEVIVPVKYPTLTMPNGNPKMAGTISFFIHDEMCKIAAAELQISEQEAFERIKQDQIFIAKGMGKSIEHLELLQLEELEKISNKNRHDQLMSARKASGEAQADPGETAMTKLQLEMQALLADKRRLELMLSKRTMKNALAEMKRYRQPHRACIGTTCSLFLVLNFKGSRTMLPVNEENGLCYLPTHPNHLQELWSFKSKQLDVSKVIMAMKKVDPTLLMEGDDIDEDGDGIGDIAAGRFGSAKQILSDIHFEEAKRASQVAGVIYEWLYTTLKLRMVYIKINAQQKIDAAGGHHEDLDIAKELHKNLSQTEFT
ncbi:hypothetical protein CYMTET_55823 [Cymbomonas tetramitiformis]|uniref:Uncharacterized protein n=1 Tax=Cymbomonas tetramitiformis TaxID=36881 RepID=A0AAE0BC61_9CHLO|nr:hypothetical protein CYMTET_55823 [Cymbomonas tetramitiformis]